MQYYNWLNFFNNIKHLAILNKIFSKTTQPLMQQMIIYLIIVF